MAEKRVRAFAVGFVSLALAVSAGAGQEYRVLKRLPLGGEGGWNRVLVDSAARRLYVARSDRVQVADADTGRVLGEVAGVAGVRGIALAQEFNRGFASNGREDTAAVFDLKSLQVLAKVPTGRNPDAVVYDPATKQVFVFNHGSYDVTVFDAQSGKVSGSLALGGKTESAQADGQGMIYVNLKDTGEVVGLDARKLEVSRRFPLRLGEKPAALAVDPVRRRVFSGCRNRIMTVVDTQTGNLIATVPIGAGVDGVACDPETGTIFSANGWDGTLTVVRETQAGKFEVAETVRTQRGARTLALDAKTHTLYLPTAQLVFQDPPPLPGVRPARPQIVKDTFEILVIGR